MAFCCKHQQCPCEFHEPLSKTEFCGSSLHYPAPLTSWFIQQWNCSIEKSSASIRYEQADSLFQWRSAFWSGFVNDLGATFSGRSTGRSPKMCVFLGFAVHAKRPRRSATALSISLQIFPKIRIFSPVFVAEGCEFSCRPIAVVRYAECTGRDDPGSSLAWANWFFS